MSLAEKLAEVGRPCDDRHDANHGRSRDMRIMATGLQFPEGPVAMEDGSVLLVEIARQTLSRVTPDGRVHVIANLGGGPNGAAMGPGGKIYVTNNGGFEWIERPGRLF